MIGVQIGYQGTGNRILAEVAERTPTPHKNHPKSLVGLKVYLCLDFLLHHIQFSLCIL